MPSIKLEIQIIALVIFDKTNCDVTAVDCRVVVLWQLQFHLLVPLTWR